SSDVVYTSRSSDPSDVYTPDSTLVSSPILRNTVTPCLRRSVGSLSFRIIASRAIVNRKRALSPESHSLMHSPLAMQALAHFSDSAAPLPNRRISSTPLTTALGSAPPRPAGAAIGQTLKQAPHLVQASSMS